MNSVMETSVAVGLFMTFYIEIHDNVVNDVDFFFFFKFSNHLFTKKNPHLYN